MGVLDKIKEAGVDKEEWLRQLREPGGFTGDDSELLKAISAYEAAHAQKIDIKFGEFRGCVGWWMSTEKTDDVGKPRSSFD